MILLQCYAFHLCLFRRLLKRHLCMFVCWLACLIGCLLACLYAIACVRLFRRKVYRHACKDVCCVCVCVGVCICRTIMLERPFKRVLMLRWCKQNMSGGLKYEQSIDSKLRPPRLWQRFCPALCWETSMTSPYYRKTRGCSDGWARQQSMLRGIAFPIAAILVKGGSTMNSQKKVWFRGLHDYTQTRGRNAGCARDKTCKKALLFECPYTM